jgi:acyl-CoA synthetase (AMP-forming)/AMP-acid ligase II/acyl carrier protein
VTDPSRAASVGELLEIRAAEQPDRLAFRDLRNDLGERDRVTYGELDRRARRLGERLSRQIGRGERALMLIPNAIDYMTALFGCFYAGVVAVSGVPAYAPSTRSSRHSARLQRLRTVIETAGANAILGPAELIGRVQQALGAEAGPGLSYIAIDELGADLGETSWSAAPGRAEAIAFLQYTSGSTTSPGGVVLRHRNLMSNLAAQAEAFQMTAGDVGVSWLPLFHDLGLIGAGLLPIYSGFPCHFMPSAGFLEQPQRWLQCLSAEGGTISWAPNFAYKLCLNAIPPEQRSKLDLSPWRIAMNAAEPVRAETVRAFIKGFAAAGFRPAAMYPAYGLAEATLAVSAPSPGEDVHIVRLDKKDLAHDQVTVAGDDDADAVEAVGCGRPVPGVEIAIVDPTTALRRLADRVGEIWVAGPGRSEGYFNAVQDRGGLTSARLPGAAEPWLRTGDLGFVRDGDLFITGRLKDLIILRGANLYPQDLEASASASHGALRDDCACAISVLVDGEEALAIICEIDRRQEHAAPEAAAAIRRAIFEHHGLETHHVVLIRMASLPKTPSGKVQRSASRGALEARELSVVFEDRVSPPEPSARRPAAGTPRTPGEIFAWVASRLTIAASIDGIGRRTVLADLGLSSVQITELAGQIEATFGRRIPAADLFELVLVSDIVERLVDLVG